MSGIKILLMFLAVSAGVSYAQQTTHRWEPLKLEDERKLWYDKSFLDSITNDHFSVWILEMHRPPLQIENVPGDVYRSKTLYTVNLQIVRYGILKVIYYDLENKEIFSYDYSLPEEDQELRYPYPVTENSFLHLIIKKYFSGNNSTGKK
ncbi:MAG: hypothetical protein Kow0098_25230 [Ignavibacteriaceae bacterium]